MTYHRIFVLEYGAFMVQKFLSLVDSTYIYDNSVERAHGTDVMIFQIIGLGCLDVGVSFFSFFLFTVMHWLYF